MKIILIKTQIHRAASSAAALALLSVMPENSHSQVHTDPHGYVKLSVAPGSGVSKKITLLSIPLLDSAVIDGASSGRITGVTSNSIICAGAGWTPGQLSHPAEPYLIEITSGTSLGRMLLVSTETPNTHDTVTISPSEIEHGGLSSLGIATSLESGDTYKIRPVDTLSSLFGTPESTLIKGGSTANSSDTITLVMNGSSSTYFFNTSSTPPRWSRVALGTPDASNVPLPPYASIQYARIANTPLEFFVTGEVPSVRRLAAVKSTGTTLLSTHWPSDQTLSSLGIHNIAGWRKSPNSRIADTVSLTSGGSVATYFHDGTNWRRISLGTPSSDSVPVPSGTGVLVTRKGQEAGYSTHVAPAPYTLD